MESTNKTVVTVEATVNAPIEKVWRTWAEPEHIKNWCFATDDWHAPHAENDLKTGGAFKTTMAAKDGSFSFDFGGIYDKVINHEHISYSMEDGRRVTILFSTDGKTTHVKESFDAESENPVEMQQAGWQAILNNFKKYTESI